MERRLLAAGESGTTGELSQRWVYFLAVPDRSSSWAASEQDAADATGWVEDVCRPGEGVREVLHGAHDLGEETWSDPARRVTSRKRSVRAAMQRRRQ
ncbi:hypothetical protein OG500_30135 [Kitasatospora sp. NBC_01250]|uniref:hypothetical protein n=1 Tax=Kitasatospora sp. NBC_01250 TaxID=2903571 RepID=UPI002E333D1D|nr:hypothetical protein [Kitasatospora sp. NBC_01250]